MSQGKSGIVVLQTNVFRKEYGKFSDDEQDLIDAQIDLIVANPSIGEQKKGDLRHLRVHKFILGKAQVLLGYSWVQKKLQLYLLSVGPHENFYKSLSKRRKADLKLIDE